MILRGNDETKSGNKKEEKENTMRGWEDKNGFGFGGGRQRGGGYAISLYLQRIFYVTLAY